MAIITPDQLVEIIGNLKEEWRREVEQENRRSMEIMKKELKEAIKTELSQMASQHSRLVDAPDPDVLATHVSAKGSCAEAVGNVVAEEPSTIDVTRMGLYIIGDDCTQLMALGKVFDSAAMIHNVPYTNDVVWVSVLTVNDDDARVPFPTLEIQYVREAINTFIGWPTHLVKPISDVSELILTLLVVVHIDIGNTSFTK